MTIVGPSIVAIISLVTALVTLYGVIRASGKVKEIHVLVNQQKTDLETRIHQLELALADSDTDVPPDPRIQ